MKNSSSGWYVKDYKKVLGQREYKENLLKIIAWIASIKIHDEGEIYM